MRKEEKLKIGDKELLVKELKVSQIIKITKKFPDFEGKNLEEIMVVLQGIVPMCVEGIKVDEIMDMTPSEMKELYDAFKKANEVFFEMLDKVGLLETLARVKTAALEGLNASFVELSQQVTAEQQITDTPSS